MYGRYNTRIKAKYYIINPEGLSVRSFPHNISHNYLQFKVPYKYAINYLINDQCPYSRAVKDLFKNFQFQSYVAEIKFSQFQQVF